MIPKKSKYREPAMLRHCDKRVSNFLWSNDIAGSGGRTSIRAHRKVKKDMTRTLRVILKRELIEELLNI